MSNNFTFQQFTVQQQHCAMKVGTDGVLLGAWAAGGRRVLDIGTGTGVIAMMMAQRFESTSIVAIDLDKGAFEQAVENVAASVFAPRIEVIHTSLQSYCDAFKPEKAACFDAIVSNPPFFVNALRNDDAGKRMARHTDSLPYASLFRAVSLLLAEKGVFSCIIPTECLADFLAESYIFGLFLQQDIAVKTTPRKPAKRHLLSFGRQKPASPMLQEQVLTDEQGARSSWYQALTKDFYIK